MQTQNKKLHWTLQIMASKINVFQYSFEGDQLLARLSPNVEILPSDVHVAYAAARIISVNSGLKSEADWIEFKLQDNASTREITRHIANHSFMPNEDMICVPTPGFELPIFDVEICLDIAELKSRHTLAEKSNFMAAAQNSEVSNYSGEQHEFPDYILVSFRNYEPFSSFCEALYYGYFVGENEKWNYYCVPSLPSDEVLQTAKAVIFSGGAYSCNDESLTWLEPVREFIRKVYRDYPRVKMLGICLGSQVLAQAFGGVVKSGSPDSYFIDIEKNTINAIGEAEIIGVPTEYFMTEAHRDSIQVLPDNAVLYGSSETCEYDIWGIPGRVLGCQGHLEYSVYVFIYFLAYSVRKFGLIPPEKAEDAILKAKTFSEYDPQVLKAFKAWFKR